MIPGRGTRYVGTNLHYYPAANWIARTLMPADDRANTLASVLRPEDLFKVYTWRKDTETFVTQEPIFAPVTIAPGEQESREYYLTLTAPLRGPVYCSPQLTIGTSPHPTGIPSDSQEITLYFAGTEAMDRLTVEATLLLLPDEQTVGTHTFSLGDLSPSGVASADVPLTLSEGRNYRLRLRLSQNGKPFHPGESVGDVADIVIPLVVGTSDTPEIVFRDRTNRDALFPRIPARTIEAPLVAETSTWAIYRYPETARCFREYTFEAAGTQDVDLMAAAGEYVSAQLVLVPRTDQALNCEIHATEFTGDAGARPRCVSVNRFLYAKTNLPSKYNPHFPVGAYPEALLPTSELTLDGDANTPLFITFHVPRDTAPGDYAGSLVLTANVEEHRIPIHIHVWDIRIPAQPFLALSCDQKAIGDVVIHKASGERMTRPEITQALTDMYLQYRLTPTGLGCRELLDGDFAAFETQMQDGLARGATSILLGTSPRLLQALDHEKLGQIESFLAARNWQRHFYVRLDMDEASPDRVDEMVRRCKQWKAFSTIPIMETWYHDATSELYGGLDIYARTFSEADWVRERLAEGDTFWRVNAMPEPMEEEPWRGRVLYWSFFDYGYTGAYLWTVKNWVGILDWGTDWWSDNGAANLSAALIWHHETGLLSTIRLEALRDGIEDHALFHMLKEKVHALTRQGTAATAILPALDEARQFLALGKISERPRSAADLERIRREAGDLLSRLNALTPEGK